MRPRAACVYHPSRESDYKHAQPTPLLFQLADCFCRLNTIHHGHSNVDQDEVEQDRRRLEQAPRHVVDTPALLTGVETLRCRMRML